MHILLAEAMFSTEVLVFTGLTIEIRLKLEQSSQKMQFFGKMMANRTNSRHGKLLFAFNHCLERRISF